MALQDLTPQLRTRLNRVEQAVGWFVLLACLLLAVGFGYYVYQMAERKGWFLIKARYHTFTDRATGLNVGDPVMLMGFEVGRITRIDAQPPNHYFNVYVEFELKGDYHGYIWTEGSRARVTPGDLFGRRVLEVTKGTAGLPTYLPHPLLEADRDTALRLARDGGWLTLDEVRDPVSSNILLKHLTPLQPAQVDLLFQGAPPTVRLADSRQKLGRLTAIWDRQQKRYLPLPKDNKGYWLDADESPAVSERLDGLIRQVEQALPNILSLTNPLQTTLSNSAILTANLDGLIAGARPVTTNLARLAEQLQEPGSLGSLALTATQQAALDAALIHAASLLANTDTNVTRVAGELTVTLEELSGITSNLHWQVRQNTNLLSAISEAVIHADEFVQGLKRHWLLRSAFKPKPVEEPAPAHEHPSYRSPRDGGRR